MTTRFAAGAAGKTTRLYTLDLDEAEVVVVLPGGCVFRGIEGVENPVFVEYSPADSPRRRPINQEAAIAIGDTGQPEKIPASTCEGADLIRISAQDFATPIGEVVLWLEGSDLPEPADLVVDAHVVELEAQALQLAFGHPTFPLAQLADISGADSGDKFELFKGETSLTDGPVDFDTDAPTTLAAIESAVNAQTGSTDVAALIDPDGRLVVYAVDDLGVDGEVTLGLTGDAAGTLTRRNDRIAFNLIGGERPVEYDIDDSAGDDDAEPTGTTLLVTGELVGVIEDEAPVQFTVEAEDAQDRAADRQYSATVFGWDTDTDNPANPVEEAAYTPHDFLLLGGTAPVVLELDPSSEALPAGMTLTQTAPRTLTLAGTPDDDTAGAYALVLRATDARGVVVLMPVTLTVAAE